MNNVKFAALALCLGITSMGQVPAATAAPIFFTLETSFQTAASGAPLPLESFEGSNQFGGPINFPGLVVTTSDGAAVSTQSDASATDGSETLTWFRSGQGDIVFTFANSISSFGIDVLDLGTTSTGPATLSMTVNGVTQALFVDFAGPGSNLLFAGVVDSNPFTTVVFSNTDLLDLVFFDRLQTSQIPEPGSLALIGLGLVWLGLARRKKTA